MTPETIAAEVERIRSLAATTGVCRTKTNAELYVILGQCAALAERCETGEALEELRRLALSGPRAGRRRVYIERGTDSFGMVCRYVFEKLARNLKAGRCNASRFAVALREAKRRNIAPADLAGLLAENGGVSWLFLRRPVEATEIRTRTLRVSEPVAVRKGGTVTLTLRHEPDNVFRVLECRYEKPVEKGISNVE